MVESDAASPVEPPSKEELKRAFKAFKKRLKVTRDDDENRMGHGPMSSGNQSAIVALTPPNQYPRAVWQALVEQGKLKNAGQGMYELVQK